MVKFQNLFFIRPLSILFRYISNYVAAFLKMLRLEQMRVKIVKHDVRFVFLKLIFVNYFFSV